MIDYLSLKYLPIIKQKENRKITLANLMIILLQKGSLDKMQKKKEFRSMSKMKSKVEKRELRLGVSCRGFIKNIWLKRYSHLLKLALGQRENQCR